MLKPGLLNCSLVALGLLVACGGEKGGGSGSSDAVGKSTAASAGGTKSGTGALQLPFGPSEGGATSAASTDTGEGGADSTDPSGVGGFDASSDIDTEDTPPTSVDTEDPPPKTGDTEDGPKGDTDDSPPGDTDDSPPGDTDDSPPGDTDDPPDGCTMTEIDKVNVIIFGDASPSGADVEGRMWVGGNATFSGYGVGSMRNDDAAPSKCTEGEYTLVVGGDLAGQVNAGEGYVAVYGTISGNVTSCNDKDSNGSAVSQRPVDFAAVEKKLKGYSLAFSKYATNGEAGVQYGALVLSGTDAELNVFSITSEQLMGIGSLKIDVPSTSSVIVNVSGKTVEWGGMGFEMPDGGKACRGASSDWCHRILWNLYEAESLTLSGIGVQGSVMAPLATVAGAGGNVDGQLVAQELLGQIEYHPYFFSGCLLLPKP